MANNTLAMLKTLGLMVLIGCLPQIASDIYAPSLPAIANDFLAPISLGQLSMALYMCGIAISLFVYGPLSDVYGRKKPLITGIIIMLFGSAICVLAHNMSTLLIGRIIQGLGVGACSGLWRSIFRDMFSGNEMAKVGSYLTIILIFVIPAAPTIGGYIQEYFGWHAIFAFLSLYTFIALYVISCHYQETSQHHDKSRGSLCFISNTYRQLFTSRTFMGYSLCVLLTYGAFFSWFTMSPVLLINIEHLSPVKYGWLNFICASGAMALGGIVNSQMVQHLGRQMMLKIGWSMMLLSGIALLISYELIGINVTSIFIIMCGFYFGITLIWPNAFSSAMEPYGHIAGTAGATYSAMQLGGGALVGAIASHLSATTPIPLSIIFISCSSLALITFSFMVEQPQMVGSKI